MILIYLLGSFVRQLNGKFILPQLPPPSTKPNVGNRKENIRLYRNRILFIADSIEVFSLIYHQ